VTVGIVETEWDVVAWATESVRLACPAFSDTVRVVKVFKGGDSVTVGFATSRPIGGEECRTGATLQSQSDLASLPERSPPQQQRHFYRGPPARCVGPLFQSPRIGEAE
jgi:hypothetical protein